MSKRFYAEQNHKKTGELSWNKTFCTNLLEKTEVECLLQGLCPLPSTNSQFGNSSSCHSAVWILTVKSPDCWKKCLHEKHWQRYSPSSPSNWNNFIPRVFYLWCKTETVYWFVILENLKNKKEFVPTTR